MSRMRTLLLVLLPTAALLASAGAHAQARGPSAREVQENGQDVGSSVPEWRPYLDELVRLTGRDWMTLASGLSGSPTTGFVLRTDAEIIYLGKLGPPPPPALDDAARLGKNQEQRAWLADLVGRFRLDGQVERRGSVPIEVEGGNPTYGDTVLTGDISGVADCDAVGAGPGIHCIINAAWPIVEPLGAIQATSRPEPLPESERFRVMRPAVVMLGLNPDSAEILGSMVDDESIAHTWAGRLESDTLTARRTNDCLSLLDLDVPPPPCFQPLEILSGPDGVITMVQNAGSVTIRMRLERDPEARAGKPVPTKKVR